MVTKRWRALPIALACGTILVGQTQVSGPIIQTYAGADWTFQADGQPATQAPIGDAHGIALDSAGNLYIADTLNYQVYRVRLDGTLNVIAGNGFDAPATNVADARNSTVNRPRSVAVGPDGSIYIAESYTIARVAPNGSLSPFAGLGSGGDGSPAITASIVVPSGLVFDSAGNLYFSEAGHNDVRKIDVNGILTTIVGTGRPGFSGDGGPAAAATLNTPNGLRFDSAGNLYIADSNNGRIRKVTPAGVISTYASQISFPVALDFDGSGNAYVAEQAKNDVLKITPAGSVTVFAGTSRGFGGDNGPASQAEFNVPFDLIVDRAGNILVADSQNGRIRRINASLTVSTYAGNGLYRFSPEGTQATLTFLKGPARVAVSPSGLVYLTDNFQRVRRVEANGQLNTVIGNGTTDFSGAGSAQASATSLRRPDGITFDSSGNLYIADGGRVLRVTPQGTVTQYAGGGSADPGAGGAAIGTSMSPSGLAMDSSGNLYIADSNGQRIEKVTPGGLISVPAGSGVAGFQDGPAASAQFNIPKGVAVDAAGNVYVADQNNNRVRKIAGGMVTTYAGNGSVSPLGDGGPATQATLDSPNDLAFDASGALLVMDSIHFSLRRITSSGTISTIAGNGQINFTGDGGPAVLASLNNPNGVGVDARGNIYIADLSNFRVRILPTAAPTIAASPGSLSFTVRSGDAPSIGQAVSVTGSVAGLPFTISSSAAFLITTATTSATPATVSITVNPGTLAPGSYSGTVTFTSTVAGVPPAIVSVSLTVQPALPPMLAVDTAGLSLSFVRGGTAASRKVVVRNSGGAVSFTAVAKTASGGAWLSVAPSSGNVTPASPVSLAVTANPAGLAPNTYTGVVAVADASGAATIAIPVTMTVSNSGQSIRLSQSGQTFQAVAGSGVTPPQSVTVLNAGQGSFPFTASAIVPAGGPQWLTVTPASSTADSSQPPPTLSIGVNQAGLAAGDYFGRVEVASAAADNSPQDLTVALRVLPAGTDPGPLVQPAGLVFTGVAGGSDPPSQPVTVTNLTSNALSFGSGVATLDGGNYIQYLPASATVQPGSLTLVVQPTFSGLAAGIHRGAITLVFSDGSIQTVGILIVIAPPGTVLGSAHAVTGCAPTQLLPLITSLGSNFNVPAAFPTALNVKVVDDCGAPLTTGSVVTSFSNGDPPLSHTSLGDGNWTATWVSRNTAQSSVSITATAEKPALQLRGTIQTNGGLNGTATPPLIGDGGIVSASSIAAQAPLAPGAMVSIYGLRLSNGAQGAASLPLGTQLAGTTVVVGGLSAPLLYSSAGQVNAVLPLALPPNTRTQTIVTRGDQYSTPADILIAPAQPGVFSTAATGKGQGHIYVAQVDGTLRLADQNNPAKAGDVLVIYCSGLGAVDSAVIDGAAAPLDHLVRALNPVTATIGGVNASVAFAGLAPGFAVGLYQVNVTVPTGVAAGDATALVLTAAGQSSPPVTLSTR